MVGRSTKKQKRDEAESKRGRMEEFDGGVGDGVISWKEQVQNMSKEEFETFLRAKVKEISNMAVDEVIEEVADKVMEEKDEDQQGQVVVGDETGVLPGIDKGREVADRILEAAAVPEACQGQTRASPRLQCSRDEHVLVKAKEQAAKKNLEFKDGMSSSTLFFRQ
jgi:hypothetical protein